MTARLYYIFMDGCGACQMAKPELKKFERAHPEVQVVPVNLLTVGDKWKHDWKPEATPTYVLEIPGHERTRYEGALMAKHIEQFIRKSKQMIGAQ
jgi:hypothetical protein